jgi:tetratricopeptide (TPR) repeat protein
LNLGAAYSRKGDSTGAERYYQQALDLARSENLPRLIAQSLLSMAALHDGTAKFEASSREATEALAFFQPGGFAKESFQCLTLLGRARLWVEDQDYNGAMQFFSRASVVAESTKDKSLIALGEESLGTTLAAQQRYPEALPHFQRELELSATDERVGYAALNSAEMFWFLGRFDEARQALTTVDLRAAKFPALRLRVLRDRAGMELSQEHFAEARVLASQASVAGSGRDAVVKAQVQGIFGMALAGSGNFTEGINLCRKSIEAAEKAASRPAIVRARLALAQAQAYAGDRRGILSTLRNHEPDAARYSESRWRVLALLSQADQQYAANARDALNALKRLWGEQPFQKYLARPDVRRLWRPLFPNNSAIP